MACANVLSKLNCNEKKFFLLMSHPHGQDGINLKLSDGAKTWNGKIDDKEFISWSKKTKLSLSDYKSQTLKALSGESLGGREFEYDVKEEGNGSANLVWKRVLDDADIKFQLGCVDLQPDRNQADSICHILEASIELTHKLQSQVQSLTEERDRLTSDRAAALQKLERCISVKEDTEHDLYSKFVVLLNNKKAKIHELKEQLDQHQSRTTSPSATQIPVAKVRKNHDTIVEESSQSTTAHRATSDDSDMEYNTDDELKDCSSVIKKGCPSGECTMKRKEEQEKEDVGLMLNDGTCDDKDSPVLPKRLRKGRQEMAKKALSKTSILHAEVSHVQPGTSRKSSLRKSSSKGSSHNLDVNNLIDAMD